MFNVKDKELDYTIYKRNIINFVRTMVIKSSVDAKLINKRMSIEGYPYDELDETTWKYYMTLAGDYHDSDKIMMVKSLDTGEMIAFTKENLRFHLTTKRSYQYGGDYYKELASNYPDQTRLIRCILNPIDYDISIDAKDYEIIWHDVNHIEWNELSLMTDLQQWIYGWAYQWYHNDYTQTDDLMHQHFMGNLYESIIAVILSIRLRYIGTNQAHSFHVWAHLGSHGRLDRYQKYLTKEQVLYFYRNICWVQRNAGKQYTFGKIIDHVLTARDIPIGSYSTYHNTEDMPDEMRPKVRFKSTPLNMKDKVSPEPKIRKTSEILEDEVPLARDNHIQLKEDIAEEDHDIMTDNMSQLPTKVLESEMVDMTDSQLFRLSYTLINEWARQASTGMYTSVITINNPNSGAAMSMNVKEAFMLYMYACWQGHKVELKTMPLFLAVLVKSLPEPTFSQLRERCASEYVPDEFIRYALSIQPTLTNTISTEAFYNSCLELTKCQSLLHDMWCYRNNYLVRAHMENLGLNFFEDHLCDIYADREFKNLFDEKGWELSNIEPEDWTKFAEDIAAVATGSNLVETTKLADIQKAMVSLTLELSSYTIHVIRKINDDPIHAMEYPALRLNEPNIKYKTHTWFTEIPIRVLKFQKRVAFTYDLNDIIIDNCRDWKNKVKFTAEIKPYIDVDMYQRKRNYHFMNVAPVMLWFDNDNPDNLPDINNVIKNTELRGLWLKPYGDPKIPISDVLDNNVLDGLWVTTFSDRDRKSLQDYIRNRSLHGLWNAKIL